MKKRILPALLALVMVLTMLPLGVLAASGETPEFELPATAAATEEKDLASGKTHIDATGEGVFMDGDEYWSVTGWLKCAEIALTNLTTANGVVAKAGPSNTAADAAYNLDGAKKANENSTPETVKTALAALIAETEAKFANVKKLDFATNANKGLNMTDLGCLVPFTGLEELDISGNSITLADDDGVICIPEALNDVFDTDLTSFKMANCGITNIDELVRCTNLGTLDISGNAGITSLNALATMTSLTSLKATGIGTQTTIVGPLTAAEAMKEAGTTVTKWAFDNNAFPSATNEEKALVNRLVDALGEDKVEGLTKFSPAVDAVAGFTWAAEAAEEAMWKNGFNQLGDALATNPGDSDCLDQAWWIVLKNNRTVPSGGKVYYWIKVTNEDTHGVIAQTSMDFSGQGRKSWYDSFLNKEHNPDDMLVPRSLKFEVYALDAAPADGTKECPTGAEKVYEETVEITDENPIEITSAVYDSDAKTITVNFEEEGNTGKALLGRYAIEVTGPGDSTDVVAKIHHDCDRTVDIPNGDNGPLTQMVFSVPSIQDGTYTVSLYPCSATPLAAGGEFYGKVTDAPAIATKTVTVAGEEGDTPVISVTAANLTGWSEGKPEGENADTYTVTKTGDSTIAVTANNLQKHTNASGTEGYWVGVAITKLEDATYEWKFRDGESTKKTTQELVDAGRVQGEDNEYVTLYWSTDNDTDPWSEAEGEVTVTVGGQDYTYTVNFTVTVAEEPPALTFNAYYQKASQLTGEDAKHFYGGKLEFTGLTPGKWYVVTFDYGAAITGGQVPRAAVAQQADADGRIAVSCQETMKVGLIQTGETQDVNGSDCQVILYDSANGNQGILVTASPITQGAAPAVGS